MLFFDPIYLLFMIPGLAMSLWASARTKSAFNKYGKVRAGMTGAQAARRMLDQAGLHDVKIQVSSGFLSDHYNPATRSLGLSPDVHDRASIAAVGVACHEAGHAIQHANDYVPLQLRSALVPTASFGSNFGYLAIMLGMFLSIAGMVYVGIALFSATVLFQLVTLPVEFDASNRAKQLVLDYGIVSPYERAGMDKVLNAAAWTYVAAAVSSILTLLYFLLRAGLLGGSDD
ncbi:MAG: zinc metallopeptidase [Bryobacterales bacterium]|nr:zinc metallopeptidase [Bryobacterales bacterium]